VRIENRDIKLSAHPIPVKWGNMFEQRPVPMFGQDTWDLEKWELYFDRRPSPNLAGGIFKTQMKLHTDPAPPAEVSFLRREINE